MTNLNDFHSQQNDLSPSLALGRTCRSRRECRSYRERSRLALLLWDCLFVFLEGPMHARQELYPWAQLQLQPNTISQRLRVKLITSGVLERLWRCLPMKLTPLKTSLIWWRVRERGGGGFGGFYKKHICDLKKQWADAVDQQVWKHYSWNDSADTKDVRNLDKEQIFFFQFRKDMNQCLEGTLFWNADSAHWQSGRQSTVWALVCGT